MSCVVEWFHESQLYSMLSIRYVLKYIKKAPNNESPWNYLLG